MEMFLKKALGFLCLILVLDILLAFLFAELAFRKATEAAAPQDAVIVLYSENVKKRLDRLDYVRSLHSDGKIDHLILVGGMRPLEHKIGAIDMGVELTHRGVSADLITADETSNDTTTSIRNGLRQAKQLGYTRVMFASDCMHLIRLKYQVSRQEAFDGEISFTCPHGSWDAWTKFKTSNYEFISFIVIHLPEGMRASLVAWLRP